MQEKWLWQIQNTKYKTNIGNLNLQEWSPSCIDFQIWFEKEAFLTNIWMAIFKLPEAAH